MRPSCLCITSDLSSCIHPFSNKVSPAVFSVFSDRNTVLHISTASTATTADYHIIYILSAPHDWGKGVFHMKIICSKSDLLRGVNIALKAVPSKTTMTILECILIDASKSDITFTSNDMELGIETTVKGLIKERGVVAIDAKIFSDIIRKLPDNDVIIETDEKFNTTITCEKAKFNIAGKSGEDFSYLPYIEKNEPVVLSQFTLKDLIRQTIFSIADNDNNKLMTGELFDIHENMLKVASLDGHRISICRVELKEAYEDRKVVVPARRYRK